MHPVCCLHNYLCVYMRVNGIRMSITILQAICMRLLPWLKKKKVNAFPIANYFNTSLTLWARAIYSKYANVTFLMMKWWTTSNSMAQKRRIEKYCLFGSRSCTTLHVYGTWHLGLIFIIHGGPKISFEKLIFANWNIFAIWLTVHINNWSRTKESLLFCFCKKSKAPTYRTVSHCVFILSIFSFLFFHSGSKYCTLQ